MSIIGGRSLPEVMPGRYFRAADDPEVIPGIELFEPDAPDIIPGI